MIIPVTFIYSEDKIDPIYEMLGLQMDADKVEILEDGYIDTDQIEAVAGSMGFTQVYTKGGHVFEIEMETEEFYSTMDVVNNPTHYQGEIECIECIKASMSKDQFIGYLKGNIIKYTWRFDRKNQSEDIKKMQVYAQWLEKELI